MGSRTRSRSSLGTRGLRLLVRSLRSLSLVVAIAQRIYGATRMSSSVIDWSGRRRWMRCRTWLWRMLRDTLREPQDPFDWCPPTHSNALHNRTLICGMAGFRAFGGPCTRLSSSTPIPGLRHAARGNAKPNTSGSTLRMRGGEGSTLATYTPVSPTFHRSSLCG